MSANPVRRVADDLAAEWRGRGKFPPGPSDFSFARTHQIAHDPLPLLLGAYEEYGPIFSMRLLHTRVVFMLGPEANHFVTVGHPENFHWRESSFGDLIPLLGDGLLTIDDDYHDRARAIMLPAFHREQVDGLDRGDGRRGRGGDRDAAPRRGRRRLRLDAQPGDADRDAGAARPRPRRRPARAPPRPSTSSAALGFYGIDFAPAPAARAGLALAQADRLARRPRRDRLRRDRPPPRRPRPGPPRHPQPACSAPATRRGEALHRPRGPRPGDDADVRRPRHLDLDPHLHAATSSRATPTCSRASARSRTGCSAARTPTIDQLEREMPYLDMVARRGAAPLSAGLDRPPPGRPRLRVRRLHGARAAPTSTTAPGPATASPRSSPTPRPSSPSASRASARRRCRAAPTSPSAAASGSASASASARPR